MVLRLWRKSILMTLREKRMFLIFMLIYTALIFLTSFFMHTTFTNQGSTLTNYFILIFFIVSLFLSLLYAWIIVARNRRTWATLKCIGYTNGNINTIVSGIIIFTTLIGFIIVLEVLFHYAAFFTYIQSVGLFTDLPVILINLLSVVVTFAMFLVVQLIAIFVANRKILKVRPIVALKKPGE